jgi:hypothetical protein
MKMIEFHEGAENAPALAYVQDNRVEGWLTPMAAHLTIELARVIGVRGRPVCEIGVHHGKFAILLGLLAGSRVVGFDLFERQVENEDDSGAGNRSIFLRNAIANGLSAKHVRAITMNSLELTADMVREHCGARPVLFSVDGGHTDELTLNDLRIAADAVSPDGVVMLDDVFHAGFPGVVSGLFAFAAERPDGLHPFCIGGGKVFLAGSAANAERYRGALERAFSGKNGSRGQAVIRRFCHRDVVVITPGRGQPSVQQLVTRTNFWRKVRNTSTGMALRRTYALLRHRARLLG